jgi:hypothetical protein
LHFSVHNVFEPFPPEHLNRFDLVHISLLAGGLKEADFKTVSDNVLSLLSIFYLFPFNTDLAVTLVFYRSSSSLDNFA